MDYSAHAPLSALIRLLPASFIPDRIGDTSFFVCAEEFFEENPLIAATLNIQTQQKYAIALENFRGSPFANTFRLLPLDHRLCMYIQDCYARNSKPGNRQEMTNLLCMLLLMFPSLRGSHLGLSRRCITGWRTLKPAKSSAPFTKDISLALAWRLLRQGQVQSAVVLMTTFCACLRVSEALSLNIQDLAFPGDPRLASYGPKTAGLNIRDAKTARYTGFLQFVRLDDVHAIKLLQAWKATTNL